MTVVARRVDLAEEIAARHQAVCEGVEQLEQRLERTRELLSMAEAATAENARLREQIRALTQRLPATDSADPPTIAPGDHERLAAERDDLLAERDGLREEREQLAWQVEVLQHEKARADERVRGLEPDLENLFVEAGNLDQQLAEARRAQHDAEELASYYANDNEWLKRERDVARNNLAEEEQRRRALERTPASEATIPAVPNSPGVPQADIVAILPAIESLAGAARTSAEATPAILASLSTLDELVRGIAEQQRAVVEWVEAQRRAEVGSAPLGHPVSVIESVEAGTYEMVANSPEDGSTETGALSEPLMAEPKPDGGDAASSAAPSVPDAPDEPESVDPVPSWEEEYARVELAWLAGLRVGDGHQGQHFLALAKRLGQHDPRLREATTLLRELDELGQRFGEGFDYCLLDTALAKLRRPVLNPTLLIVEMNHLKRRRHRHHG